MNLHPFAYVMVATLLAAVVTMLLGVAQLGKSQNTKAEESGSNKLMALRVGLCILLLAEILIYVNFLKP